MKKLWPILLAALFVFSCGDDKTNAPEGEEYSEASEFGSSDSNGKQDPQHSQKEDPKKDNSQKSDGKKDDGKKDDSKPEEVTRENPFGEIDSSKINTEDLKDIPKMDTLVVDTAIVETKTELPSCTAANEGETFMVDEETSLYFCINGEWQTSILGLVKASCSDGNLTVDPFTPSDEAELVEDSLVDLYRRVAVPVAGIAEKGPFRFGSTVRVVELDSAKRLADSERAHEACVASANGSYVFPGINLVSPYVRVEVKGYYWSELSGGLSSSMITLHTLTDLTERDSVNVNMLTYMEAPRVMKLVENSGFNQPIRGVKAQALKEILYAFNIDVDGTGLGGNNGGFGGGFGGFGGWGGQQTTTPTTESSMIADDVSLFGDEKYGAALLALSIMMQRNGSGPEMLRYADAIADRIKGNGNWDDFQAKADLADWLMELDASGGYERIRNVVRSWGMGEAPDFEKHLRKFWSNEYGFQACNASTNGQVLNVNTSLSAYFAAYYDHPDSPKIRFICDNAFGAWRVATDLEKDTYGLGVGEYDGQIKAGRINVDKFYVYEQKERSWREATSKDILPFSDVKDVYDNLASDEKVVFVLRHAERTDDTGKNGHLTDNGKKQSESVGAKFKGVDMYFAHSGYVRAKETAEYIAIGSGKSSATLDSLPFLDGDWFVKDANKVENYKNTAGGGWQMISKYAYLGGFTDAMYDEEERAEELIQKNLKPMLSRLKKANFMISHDQMVVPLTVYCTEKRVNLRHFENQTWINYLAGVAIIFNSKGDVRYEPVRGIESGTMRQ